MGKKKNRHHDIRCGCVRCRVDPERQLDNGWRVGFDGNVYNERWERTMVPTKTVADPPVLVGKSNPHATITWDRVERALYAIIDAQIAVPFDKWFDLAWLGENIVDLAVDTETRELDNVLDLLADAFESIGMEIEFDELDRIVVVGRSLLPWDGTDTAQRTP